MNKARKEWLDIAKGMACFLIVMSHSYPPVLYARIYTPVFLAIFFFSSGYTFSPRRSLKEFAAHKARTLLIPYWCFGLFNTAVAWLMDGDPLFKRLEGLLLSRNGVWDDLWFIMCLFSMQFMMYLLHTALRKKDGNRKYAYMLLTSFMVAAAGYFYIRLEAPALPLQMETACVMFPFMVLGYVYRQTESKETFCSCRACIVSAAVFMILVFALPEQTVNIHKEVYSNWWLFMLQAFAGTIMLMYMSKWLSQILNARLKKAVVYLGANTFTYYALQSKVIRVLGMLIPARIFAGTDTVRLLMNPVIALMVCCILAVPSWIINRYFPFVLGRFKKGSVVRHP